MQSPPGHHWKILGGEGRFGILVRSGKGLDSMEIGTRLAVGSMVEEVELDGNRLHYRMVEGQGPPEGWITTQFKGKSLAVRVDQPARGEEITDVLPVFLPGDSLHVYSVSGKRWAEDGVVQEVAEEAFLADGQRMPKGSLLVAYDGGKNMKWVSPSEQKTILKKMPVFVPGDKVHVWSINGGCWAEDGVVEDVAPEPVVVDGQEVPRGSAFVVYNGGKGMKCITPPEQSQLLRLALPAPGWFAMGDKVHVWSVNGNAWLEDGVVEQIAGEDLLMDGQQVARGAVFVVYNRGAGMKWVMPWEQEQLLRGTQQALTSEEGQVDDLAAEYEGDDEALSHAGDAHVPTAAAVAAPEGETEEDDMEEGELMVANENWEHDGPADRPTLALLFGTVITVLRQDARDGWLYGKRLDGAKGWFPADKVKPESEFRFNASSSEDEDETLEQEASG